MTNKIFLSMTDVDGLAELCALRIYKQFRQQCCHGHALKVYAVPRGGVPAAFAIGVHLKDLGIEVQYTEDTCIADVLIDDLIDSGNTEQSLYKQTHAPLYVLIDKRDSHLIYHNRWIVFPWEHSEQSSIRDNVTRLVQYLNPGNPNVDATVNIMMENLSQKELTVLNHTIRNEHYGTTG